MPLSNGPMDLLLKDDIPACRRLSSALGLGQQTNHRQRLPLVPRGACDTVDGRVNSSQQPFLTVYSFCDAVERGMTMVSSPGSFSAQQTLGLTSFCLEYAQEVMDAQLALNCVTMLRLHCRE